MSVPPGLTEAVMILAPPGGLFNETVVGNLFSLGSDGARKQLVHRAVARGEISRLKPWALCVAPGVSQDGASPVCRRRHSGYHRRLITASFPATSRSPITDRVPAG